ncbi:MAG TPA: thioredoxin domain-containing protein [Gemmatimonadaceae bacterium]|nr:thioredoxin domain-containing protein [Gemmatimonadaceae bacterium]
MNRLANEASPYLRQHADNPVDWYPWGPEALERASREDRPILLSIGYSACHWCHVMERESFENEGIARLMNEYFVNIKVDREERPDLDAIYMTAVQAMTGHGGWPMTVFLTPDGTPFYGGTYFPPEDRPGIPSFPRVLAAVAASYRDRRGDIENTASQVQQLYDNARGEARPTGQVDAALLQRAFRSMESRYDHDHGGFDGAPKFPQSMSFDFMLRHWRRTGSAAALDMAHDSFRAMARGGIHDQIGGGFHRYTVDAKWLVPHFEKMLYDNALLARLGAHLWQATGDEEARRVAEDTVDWVAREMTSPEGGFYSALDADSEGEEGKFYLWDESEIDELLGADAPIAKAHWGVTAGGNFEGKNILHVAEDPALVAARRGLALEEVRVVIARSRETLYAARAKRVWPARDDKVIASWNGLMLRAIAECSRAFGRDDYRELALRNGALLFREMVREGSDGLRVLRTRAGGASTIAGYLEDHAALGLGALSLYELTFDRLWLDRARALADSVITWFWDHTTRALFDTASDHEKLVTRPREPTDTATPSGNSLAVELLLRMAEIFDDGSMRERATTVLASLAAPMSQYGAAFGHLLGAADLVVNGALQVAIVGDQHSAGFAELAREVGDHYLPSLVLAGGPVDSSAGIALLADRPTLDGHPTAYVCRNYTCQLPVTEPRGLREQLEEG